MTLVDLANLSLICTINWTGNDLPRISNHLKNIRMEKAKQLLPGSETIEEVAEQIGLGHDIWYFYKLFKNHKGVTPKDYKKGSLARVGAK